MNKKILVLAFVSMALIFGCSIDGQPKSNPSSAPPGWTVKPIKAPSTPDVPNPVVPPTGSNYAYCVIYDYDYGEYFCESMSGHTDAECYNADGYPSNTCPNY